MIRNVLLSLLFFFGPVLLMFVLRHLGLLMRLWLMARRARAQPDVIDITPGRVHKPSKAFVIIAVIAGLIFAVLAWQRLTTERDTGKRYVPAQLDAQGNIIPGHFE